MISIVVKFTKWKIVRYLGNNPVAKQHKANEQKTAIWCPGCEVNVEGTIIGLAKHLWRSYYLFTIFAKKFYLRCFIGSISSVHDIQSKCGKIRTGKLRIRTLFTQHDKLVKSVEFVAHHLINNCPLVRTARNYPRNYFHSSFVWQIIIAE